MCQIVVFLFLLFQLLGGRVQSELSAHVTHVVMAGLSDAEDVEPSAEQLVRNVFFCLCLSGRIMSYEIVLENYKHRNLMH